MNLTELTDIWDDREDLVGKRSSLVVLGDRLGVWSTCGQDFALFTITLLTLAPPPQLTTERRGAVRVAGAMIGIWSAGEMIAPAKDDATAAHQ